MFVGKIAGAAKEMAVAWRYGVSAEVDAYLFVFNLVSWPVALWFSVLMVVLVPLAARIRQDTPADLPRFRSELLGVSLLLGAVLTALVYVGLPFVLRSSWAGLPPGTEAIAIGMTPALTLLVPLGVVVALFSAWILAAGRHTNTLLEGVPALVLLIAVLAFPGGGVAPLVWGTVAGVGLQLVSLSFPLARRAEIEAPSFERSSPQWPTFRQGFGIMLVGQALMSVLVIVDQFFAAHIGTGAIAMLGYANRILVLILGLGATAVTRGTLPVFSEAQAQGGGQLYRVALHWVRLLFVLGVAAAVVGWLLAPWAVELLFERGAFTARDTSTVIPILRYGLAQLPFYFASLVLVSMVVSQRRYLVIAVIGALNLVTKIAANVASVPYFGVKGLMLATSVMLAMSCLFLSIAVFRNNNDRDAGARIAELS